MQYLKAALISILSLSLTWGAASALYQLHMGECAIKGGCAGNVQVSIVIGLFISGFFVIPFLLALYFFLKGRTARHTHALRYTSVASGLIAGALTASTGVRLLGMPYDLLLWPVVFLLVSVAMVLLFYGKRS